MSLKDIDENASMIRMALQQVAGAESLKKPRRRSIRERRPRSSLKGEQLKERYPLATLHGPIVRHGRESAGSGNSSANRHSAIWTQMKEAYLGWHRNCLVASRIAAPTIPQPEPTQRCQLVSNAFGRLGH